QFSRFRRSGRHDLRNPDSTLRTGQRLAVSAELLAARLGSDGDIESAVEATRTELRACTGKNLVHYRIALLQVRHVINLLRHVQQVMRVELVLELLPIRRCLLP